MAKIDLKPYPNNPRKITKKQLQELGGSMEEFGDLSGIVFNKRDGFLISGHQRLKSIMERIGKYDIKITKERTTKKWGKERLGILTTETDEEIPFREVDWDEGKAAVARFAANHLGGDDDPMLVEKELKKLIDLGKDIRYTGLNVFKQDKRNIPINSVTQNAEQEEIDNLKLHSKQYINYPEDQIAHIIENIKELGIYKNIIVTKDGTILSGQDIYFALKKMGIEKAPIIRMDIDPDSPKALKILIGDNETSHLREVDDRQLSEILKEIKDKDDLAGTGYDERMLANLVYVSRPESEIQDFDAAAEWVGMPEFDSGEKVYSRLVISFEKEEDRLDFARKIGVKLTPKTKSLWWPLKERDDLNSIKFE